MPVLTGPYQPNSSIFTYLLTLKKGEKGNQINLVYWPFLRFFLQSPPHHIVRRCLYPCQQRQLCGVRHLTLWETNSELLFDGMGWGWDEKIKQKIQNLVINQKDFMAETISTQRLTNVVLSVRSVTQKVSSNSKETNRTLLKVVVYNPNTSGAFMAK